MNGQLHLFDPIRKKFIVLTPEEWVRQHFIHYLISEKGFPAGLCSIEGGVTHAGKAARYDVLFYNREGQPLLLIECKAPSVTLSTDTLHQLARYNRTACAPYVAVTNGLAHCCYQVNAGGTSALEPINILDYAQLCASEVAG